MRRILLFGMLALIALLVPAQAWASAGISHWPTVDVQAQQGYGSHYSADLGRYVPWTGAVAITITGTPLDLEGHPGEVWVHDNLGTDNPLSDYDGYPIEYPVYFGDVDFWVTVVDDEGVSHEMSPHYYLAVDSWDPETTTTGPVTVKRSHAATFSYWLMDYGCTKDCVSIKVYDKSGRSAATYQVGMVPTGKDDPLTFRTKVKLPRGEYTWQVIAKDPCGCPQAVAGEDTLTVD